MLSSPSHASTARRRAIGEITPDQMRKLVDVNYMGTYCATPRQDAAVVADAIAHAIERPVAEVFPHFKSRALVWANTCAPGWTDRVVKRFGRKPVR